MHLSFQKVFFVLGSVFGFVAFLVLAKEILIPLAFAFLISFILLPVSRKFEKWGANRIVSAVLSMFSMTLILVGGIFIFSNQIVDLSENFTDFKEKILQLFADVTHYINQKTGLTGDMEPGDLLEKLKSWLSRSGGDIAGQTFSGTSHFLVGLISTIVFTFLILIYRSGLVRAMVHFFPQENRERAFKMFKSVQKVGQHYLLGMTIIVLILGFVNSIGLWIIGVDNPFLFGFLAAILAIIPYVGTLVGAAIPILYAFMSYDSIWMPITIAIFFWAVQFIESNFLTPKIVGGNLKVNALTSILSIIIGASIWGVAGMILFLPFSAMFKEVCEEYIELKPVAMLIGDRNYNDERKDGELQSKWFKKIRAWFSKFRVGTSKN
jgi:predicted PurR-regulated permease PerM